MTIMRDVWLAELEAIAMASTDPGGMTVAEMREASGMSRELIRRMLSTAIQSGAWELAGTRRITRIDGRPSVTPCYRPKEKKP